MNKLTRKQLYLWIIIFAMQMLVCVPSNANKNTDLNNIEELTAEDCYFNNDLTGISILITAGPTREFMDSVTYITTKGSGKNGLSDC